MTELSRDEALVAAALWAGREWTWEHAKKVARDTIHSNRSASGEIRTALAGEAKAGDDECAKGNHAWRGPLLGWWRCVLCGEKTGDAGHPSKTKLASLERAVLAACVEERRAFELRQALPSQIEAVTRYDDAIRARRAAVTQYVAALDAKSSSSEQQG